MPYDLFSPFPKEWWDEKYTKSHRDKKKKRYIFFYDHKQEKKREGKKKSGANALIFMSIPLININHYFQILY
jgi:hypothetical protein